MISFFPTCWTWTYIQLRVLTFLYMCILNDHVCLYVSVCALHMYVYLPIRICVCVRVCVRAHISVYDSVIRCDAELNTETK